MVRGIEINRRAHRELRGIKTFIIFVFLCLLCELVVKFFEKAEMQKEGIVLISDVFLLKIMSCNKGFIL
jgi:hypothetical protein